MKNLTVLFILLLTGCGVEATKDIVSIDPLMQPYVDAFVEEGAKESVSITITSLIVTVVPTIPGSAVGLCYVQGIDGSGIPTIQIDQQYWNYADPVIRKVIIFHELGHCVLFRQHLNTWTGSIVTSIMYAKLQDGSMYLNHWAYYMHELFHGY